MNKTGFIQFNRVRRSRMFGPFYFMEKIKKTRTPKNGEQITKGALSLSLDLRVDLRDKLNDSIRKEVTDLQAKAEHAAKIANKTE